VVFAEYVFMCVYSLEIAIKVTGLGWFGYWADAWHKFDLLIVLGSWLTILLGVRMGLQVPAIQPYTCTCTHPSAVHALPTSLYLSVPITTHSVYVRSA
jgi:hypothetical protein